MLQYCVVLQCLVMLQYFGMLQCFGMLQYFGMLMTQVLNSLPIISHSSILPWMNHSLSARAAKLMRVDHSLRLK